MRELVGDDGRRVADFMLAVLDDDSERTETRMQAASWLADRGFGRAAQPLEATEPTRIVVESIGRRSAWAGDAASVIAAGAGALEVEDETA